MTESASDFLSLPPLHVLLPWLLGAVWLLLLGLTCLLLAFRGRHSLPDRMRWALLTGGALLIVGVFLL